MLIGQKPAIKSSILTHNILQRNNGFFEEEAMAIPTKKWIFDSSSKTSDHSILKEPETPAIATNPLLENQQKTFSAKTTRFCSKFYLHNISLFRHIQMCRIGHL